MVELIAKNTIQRVLDGKFITHAPGTRFEMLDDDAHDLVRMRAAVLVSQNETLIKPDVYAIQAPDTVPATVVAQDNAETTETAVGEAENEAESEAEPAKRPRKGKTTQE